MPQFLPFRGIRYRLSDHPDAPGGVADVGAVTAPPYDVIDEDERVVLRDRHPRNSVRLILPEPRPGVGRYEAAAADLRTWQADGGLVADREPRFYGYRMEFRDEDGHPRRTSGFLGALALAGPGSEVLPHERTLPKAKSDRLALLRATRANLDPVWALSLAPGLTDLLPATVLAECTDDEGVRHQLLDGGDPDLIAAVQESVGRAPVVLADGHHRFETATTFRDEERAEGHRVPGADAIMALVVELADRELTVQPIHRLLHGLPPGFDLRAALAPSFEVHDAGPATPEGVGALRSGMRGPSGGLGLADGGGLALLRPRPDSLERALADVADALRVVDATAFERLVLPALPRVEVTYRNDAATVAALVTKGAADAAVLLRPVTVAQIRDAATAGLRMPQKTTFFAPKPRTGMVFRSLDL